MDDTFVMVLGLAIVGGTIYYITTSESGGGVASTLPPPPPANATYDKNRVRNIYPTSTGQYYSVTGLGSGKWSVPGQLLNQEITIYAYVSSGVGTITIKMRGGCGYAVSVPFPNTTVRNSNLQKQCASGVCGQRTATQGNILNIHDRWLGIKAASWNQLYTGNKMAVRLQAWLDLGNSNGSSPANRWRLWFDSVDYGVLANCTGSLKPPILKSAGGPVITINNSPGAQIKWVSAREIRVVAPVLN